MAEVKPNTGKSMQDIVKDKKKSKLPDEMYHLIASVLVEFQYDDKKIVDITRYVLNADVDTALEDCVPMYTFFSLCENKYDEMENAVEERIKIMLESGVTDKGETVTQQKGRIKGTAEYQKLIVRRLRLSRLKRNCRVLANAMQMRRDVAQTRSANYRMSMQPGSYVNRTV